MVFLSVSIVSKIKLCPKMPKKGFFCRRRRPCSVFFWSFGLQVFNRTNNLFFKALNANPRLHSVIIKYQSSLRNERLCNESSRAK